MNAIVHREGVEAGRLDMFVDGAFAFTLTLLVIGGGVIPSSTDKLLIALGGIPAFAASFFQITFFWHGHVRWRERCPESDTMSRWLSLLLVFFALIFIYPLHMVFASVFNGISPIFPSEFRPASTADMRILFACYGLCYACMAGTLTALFHHAARRAEREGFDAREAQLGLWIWSVPAVIGLVSALVALLMPLEAPGWLWALPGCMYSLLFLIGPVAARFRRRYGMA
ncbi:TMEM175 family protein [Dyella subtropica]|uniref:TMEM175 family protein n=1 Tax=Dyella subtropica TaxID=2992127 RepID=UPI0022564A35|nr:TMEM175 family protein [Dyella subtropica]